MSIQAPYRFVPLSSLVVLPEWAHQVSHDRPFRDGLCGELGVTITAHTDICVGGEQTPSSDQHPGIVNFFKTPDGKPAIPASSLKGMLRNVLEIVTFSRFKQVEDQRLGVRDISQSQNFYTQAITREKPKSGWLSFNGQEWVIQPCRFVRVHQQDIIKYFSISYDAWKNAKTIKQRYNALSICPAVHFDDQYDTRNGKSVASLNKTAKAKGQLVVTGQPGPAFKENRHAKKYEFIFFSAEQKHIPIQPEIMSGFLQIHADTDEWKFWQQHLNSLAQGIPVFYHDDPHGAIRSMGLAMMYKLAYKHSIHDAIDHTSELHIKSQRADFADLLFGFISDEQSLRGRVNIGLGVLQQNDYKLKLTKPTVLSSPKPTYYPLYVRQTTSREFNQLMQDKSLLSGWKRYLVKPQDILDPPEKSTSKVQVRFETLAPDSVFNCRIRFHNLRPVELGALLWVLDFGGRSDLRHQIGVGKPYGLGQVTLALQPDQSKLRRNDHQYIDDTAILLKACQRAFEEYMENIFSTFGQSWQSSNEITALLAYATYDERSTNLSYLPTPTDYAKKRKTEFLQEFIDNFHQYAPTTIDGNTTLDFASNIDLQQHLQAAQEEFARQQTKAERDQRKNDATEEDRMLMELEDFVARAAEGVTNTMKKNADSKFRDAFAQYWSYFSDEQKQQFRTLAQQTLTMIPSKAMEKLLKKINSAE